MDWILAALEIARAVLWLILQGMRSPRGSRQLLEDCRRFGIAQVYTRRERQQRASRVAQAEGATNEIFFVGLSLPERSNNPALLIEKVQSRAPVRVRVLLPDPSDYELIETIARFLERPHPYPSELVTSLSNFRIVFDKVGGEFFQVRVHNTVPAYSASIYDRCRGQIELYSFGWLTDKRPDLELAEGLLTEGVIESLDRLWRAAIPLQTLSDFDQRIEAARRTRDRLLNALKEQE